MSPSRSRQFVAAALILGTAPFLLAQRHTLPAHLAVETSTATAPALTAADVSAIVSQAAGEAERLGMRAVIAVVDREDNVLAVFRMDGAPRTLTFRARRGGAIENDGHGLEGLTLVPSDGLPGAGVVVLASALPDPTVLAALTKAGTAAAFETSGNAFSTRSASFIIQEHFPPAVHFQPGGPLFGVQFSNLPCSDVKPVDAAAPNFALPLGLSGDPGGLPLYKAGIPVGGIGVEADGIETVDFTPADRIFSGEESAALAGTRGFEAPAAIRADQIVVNGIRLPYVASSSPDRTTSTAGTFDQGPRDGGRASRFAPVTVGSVEAAADPRFYPAVASPSGGLTAGDVERILEQGLTQAVRTRAAIRMPLGSSAQVNIAVSDASGRILGIVRTPDAPVFGFDVSAQKARTAAFYSSSGAASALTAAGMGEYVEAALRDGLSLEGSVAFTDRAGGFLSRPFFPDGIDGTEHGPFSRPIDRWSPLDDGLQSDLLRGPLLRILTGAQPLAPPCTDVPALANGIQIFPGSVPLYKGGVLVGGVGVSGDGVDQDDIISFMASAGFEAPVAIRSDRVFVRGVRLPFTKFPRQPDL